MESDRIVFPDRKVGECLREQRGGASTSPPPAAHGGGLMTKSKRFEIFKRDSFTCQYCGQRPPIVVLEVDHIDPKSRGGSDEEINLITSCADCNRGKRDKPLGEKAIRPDADLAFLQIQQEVAEARRYLDAKQKLDEVRAALIASLQATWQEHVHSARIVPDEKIITRWLFNFSPEEIEEAIRRGSIHFAGKQFHGGFEGMVSYVAGILWHTRRSGEAA